jgi:hypothetical protein
VSRRFVACVVQGERNRGDEVKYATIVMALLLGGCCGRSERQDPSGAAPAATPTCSPTVDARGTLKDGACVVGSNADCRASWYWCKVQGRCYKLGKLCVAQAEVDCKASEDCAKRGQCRLEGYTCKP